MSRVGRVGVLLVLLVVGAIEAAADSPPNILFLFTDDQRHDALGFRHPVLETPNIDQLFDVGVSFSNAFVTDPICPSSRVTVLSGLHERSHGSAAGPPLALRFFDEMYPRLLRDAGYVTGFVGKNGARFDDERLDHLFDSHVVVSRDPYIQERDGEVNHATDYTADKAVEFLSQQSSSQPFVLTVWFNAPHADDNDPVQFIPPPRYADLYQGIDHPDPPTGDQAFFDSQPEFIRTSLGRVRWEWRWTPDLYDSMMSAYLAMIRGVDDAIGEILAELENRGLAGNTVIIFSSDNGFFVGERGMAGKWLPYEPSIRVPLVIVDPRLSPILQGRELQQLVLNVDIPETILELAGLSIPDGMQGQSLVPLLGLAAPPWREDFYLEHCFTRPPNLVIPRHESLRTSRFKYAHYVDHDHEELYDLTVDPDETVDLADDPAFASDLVVLRERTVELRDEYAGVLFRDGFESGDGAGWSTTTGR